MRHFYHKYCSGRIEIFDSIPIKSVLIGAGGQMKGHSELEQELR